MSIDRNRYIITLIIISSQVIYMIGSDLLMGVKFYTDNVSKLNTCFSFFYYTTKDVVRE
jgi:hypothetical protein